MIIDANQWGDFRKKAARMTPVHEWLNKGKGRLLYSNYGKFKKEIGYEQREYLQSFKEKGRAKFISEQNVKTAVNKIKHKVHKIKHEPKSNDIHILGLALAGKARLLCSKDEALRQDFKNIIKGKIYQNHKHKKLLDENPCPA